MHSVALFAPLLATAAAADSTVYAANDPSIYYSPFAWQVTDTAASTINSAA